MRVPISWLREYVAVPDDAQTIADHLAMLGFPVDAIESRPTISGVIVGRISALARHPNADRLQVCTVDVGADKPLTIATAATNVAVGLTIPVATIGAQLPQLRIELRSMRGVKSEGMLCSPDELALPPQWFEEDGIMQLDHDLPLGADVVELFGLRDAILNVDVTSNRPDALCMIGLARELAAALHVPVRLPPFENPGTQPDPPGTTPAVALETPDCTRFVAQRFDGVRVALAPSWMRIRLALAGQRPIDNVVDVSNYVMLEVGQPLHFYDADKIADNTLIVRDARAGEKIITLDGAERKLSAQDMVIADANGPQCLAGLMGGRTSEVDPQTTALVLEAANFVGPRVRRMSAHLGLRSEASSRHEKSLAPALTDMGAARAAQLLLALGASADAPHAFGSHVEAAAPIVLQTSDVQRILGLTLDDEIISRDLTSLGCAVTLAEANSLWIVPPAWRADITGSADIIEEVARMQGYDNIVAAMPAVVANDIPSSQYRLENQLATFLVGLGYYEIMSYALHGPSLFQKLQRAGIQLDQKPVEVRNPLSEDQRYLRSDLASGIVEYFERIAKPVRVFELGHTFEHRDRRIGESAMLAFGFTVEPVDEPTWSDRHFLRIKGDALAVVREVTGRSAEVAPGVRTGLHPGKTGIVLVDGREAATVGRLDPRVARAFDVSLAAYIATISLDALPEHVAPRYQPSAKFPSTYRDVAVVVATDVPAARVTALTMEAAGALCTGARAFDEYRGPQIDADRKSLAVRITLQRADATITDAEADAVIARVLEALRTGLSASIRE